MAGGYDRNWGKSKGARTQFRLEGLQPFKSTYPVHLTDIMDASQSSQTGLQRTDFATSPVKENRTRAVREYEQTIDQLRKENFDLKLKIFLIEEESRKRLCNVPCSNGETDNCVEVIVNLRVETEGLRKELNDKDLELKNALEEVEKTANELKEVQDKLIEQQEILSVLEQLPRADEFNEIRDQYLELVHQNESLNNLISEKENEIQEAKCKLVELESRNCVLEDKIKKRNKAIEGFCIKLQRSYEECPKGLRPFIKAAVEAAQENDETAVLAALENIKESLCQIMPEPSKILAANSTNKNSEESHLQDSSGKISSSKKSSETLKESQSSDVVSLHSISSSSEDFFKKISSENLKKGSFDEDEGVSSVLRKSSDSDEESNLNKLLDENECLKQIVKEKVNALSNLSSICSDLEKKEKELTDQLEAAIQKINYLDQDHLSKGDNSTQTDIQWHLLESKISDKNLQDFGNSNNIGELKEEILMLILAIEQKDKELSDSNEKIIALQNDINKSLKKDDVSTQADEDFSAERDELQRRLAISCSVNNELLKHLQSLERFMEDLLHQKNLSTSSVENINETTDFFAQLSKCLDESLKLSHTLSDQLSICEGSKIFEPNDSSAFKNELDFSNIKSYENILDSRSSQDDSVIPSIFEEGRNNFYSTNKKSINLFGAGRRRLSFSSVQKSSVDSLTADLENVVVLKTSNNEDLILLLNDRGDPEDVLIRNNHSYPDKVSDQHRRQCWDTSVTSYLKNCEKFDHFKNNEQINRSKPEYVRYNAWMSSDSDTWSEPDRNISLQRIGIDVQTSPVTSRSPRKSRFKDRRIAEDSTKNESTSSYVKLSAFSRRRRSSETSKMSFICKKCQKQSSQVEDFSREGSVGVSPQAIKDRSSCYIDNRNEINDLHEALKSKEELIESLIQEKNFLCNSVNDLKEELAELRKNNELVISRNKNYVDKLTEKDKVNKDLKNIINSLEQNVLDSNVLCDNLQRELSETKERLIVLDDKCYEYENKLSSCLKDKQDYEDKLKALEDKEHRLTEDIKELMSQKNSLSDKLKTEEEHKTIIEKEKLELAEKLEKNCEQISELIANNRKLEEDLQSSNSLCDKSNREKNVLEDEVKNLKSCCESYEEQIHSLSSSKENIIERLLNMEHSFVSNLKTLSNMIGASGVNLQSHDTSFFSDEDKQIEDLMNRIEVENHKFKSLVEEMSQKLDKLLSELKETKLTAQTEKQTTLSLKQQLENKEEDIRSLKEYCDNLQAKLKTSVETFRTSDEEQKSEITSLLKNLEERENENRSLTEENGHLTTEIESLKIIISDYESNVNELKSSVKESSSREEIKLRNSLQELEEKERKIKTLMEDKSRLLKKVTDLENKVKESEKSLSRIGDLSFEKLISSKISPSKVTKSSSETPVSPDSSNLVEAYSDSVLLSLQKSSLDASIDSPKLALSSRSDHSFTVNAGKANSEKYLEIINALQSKLDMAEKRVEALEKESNSTLFQKSCVSGKLEDSVASVGSSKSDQSLTTDSQKEDSEKYIKCIKTLQTKLSVAEKRIELLEKEKSSLRENLITSMQYNKKAKDDINVDDENLSELKSKLETKQTFIKELKSDLYKAHDSLIDKQKENDKLQRELLKYKKIAEENSRALHQHIPTTRVSDSFLLSTESNISDLRKQKRELINSLLNLQKQFYEAKNIHLRHFEKFNKHIDDLRSLQVNPNLLKSESAPLLNSTILSNIEQTRKWDRTLKNTQIDLEVDVECLQNFKIFLKRFFTPIMLQCNDNKNVSYKKDPSINAGASELTKKSNVAIQSQEENFKAKEMFKLPVEKVLDSVSHMSVEEEPSHDRLALASANISAKIDWIQNALKSILEEFHELNDLDSFINETSRKTAAKSLLLKIYDGIQLLKENAEEIFYLNSALKSLDVFGKQISQNISKQDISDRESLLSEETITLSRSVSLSPVSFEEHFQSFSVRNSLRDKDQTRRSDKHIEDQKQMSLRPSHKLISSSQDSVFQRSHYSSPDLGIESDPNHEHSAPEQIDKFHPPRPFSSRQDLLNTKMLQNFEKQARPSIYNYSNSSIKFPEENLSLSISSTLHAIGVLQEYELLKKEVAESLVGIKSVLSRTGDGLLYMGSPSSTSLISTSPRKRLESSTLKAIKDTCVNVEVCLQKAHKLISNFWIAPCPSEEELRILLHHNEELNEKLKKLFDSKKKQEKDFKDVLERLKRAEIIKEQQEQKISKKLVKTKKVLRLAEKKILETKNTELPMFVKRSSKVPFDKL